MFASHCPEGPVTSKTASKVLMSRRRFWASEPVLEIPEVIHIAPIQFPLGPWSHACYVFGKALREPGCAQLYSMQVSSPLPQY